MASERTQRQIDRLLDEAEEAMDRLDLELVSDVANGRPRFLRKYETGSKE